MFSLVIKVPNKPPFAWDQCYHPSMFSLPQVLAEICGKGPLSHPLHGLSHARLGLTRASSVPSGSLSPLAHKMLPASFSLTKFPRELSDRGLHNSLYMLFLQPYAFHPYPSTLIQYSWICFENSVDPNPSRQLGFPLPLPLLPPTPSTPHPFPTSNISCFVGPCSSVPSV